MLPEEKEILQKLRLENIKLNKMVFPEHKLLDIGDKIVKLIQKTYQLNRNSFEGYRNYLIVNFFHIFILFF